MMNEVVTRWGWLAVVLLGITLYAPSLTFSEFHFDDEDVIVENSAIHTLRHPTRFFLDPSTGRTPDADPHDQDHGYRPLVTLSFALDYAWSGADGRGYRAVNLVIHLATAVLTIGLCRALGLSASAAWLAGVAMVAHPVHVQIVDYISSRSSGLSAALVVGAAWAYLSFRRGGAWRHYVLALTLGASALLAKESAAVLPALLAVIEWVGPWRTGLTLTRRRWRYLLPFFVLSGVFLGLRLGVFGSILREVAIERAVGFTAALTGLRVLAAHALLWVYPFPLSLDHPLPLAEHVWTGPMLVAFGIVAAGAALVLYGVRSRSPVLVVGPTWFIVSLLPSLALPFVTIRSLLFEHRAYAADVGLAMLTAVAGLTLYERASGSARRLVVGVGMAVVVTWSVLTVAYEATWKTHTGAWAHAVRLAPDSLTAQYYLGETLFREGRDDEALAAFLRARELNPFYKDIAFYVDALRRKHRDWLRVIVANRSILRRDPKREAAHFNLGVAFQKLGATDEAKASYQAAIALWPGRAQAHSNLGVIFLEENRLDTAIDHFQQALSVDPSSIEARYNLATTYTRAGEKEKARGQYIDLLRLLPETSANYEYRTTVKEQLAGLERSLKPGR
jgi:tetratricopeptide (TPR) repeat protein